MKAKTQKQTKLSAQEKALKRKRYRDFPGGAVVKNLPANAGDTGSSPGPGRFPHAVEQLSLCTTTTEPARHNY